MSLVSSYKGNFRINNFSVVDPLPLYTSEGADRSFLFWGGCIFKSGLSMMQINDADHTYRWKPDVFQKRVVTNWGIDILLGLGIFRQTSSSSLLLSFNCSVSYYCPYYQPCFSRIFPFTHIYIYHAGNLLNSSGAKTEDLPPAKKTNLPYCLERYRKWLEP